MPTADLLLHPVRFQIIGALLDGRARTTAELGEALPGIPVATLYRHIAKLADAAILLVDSETRVRGAVERRYRLDLPNAVVDAAQARTMTAEDHRRAFGVFVATLLADFDRYLAASDIDLARDGVGYSQAALWLTDEELAELTTEIAACLTKRQNNSPTAGRVKRALSTVMIPDRR